MDIRTAVVVDIGTTYDKNDDRALIETVIYQDGIGERVLQTPFLAAVCDGVGGSAGGGYAANLILTQLAGLPAAELSQPDALADALANADRKLKEEQLLLPEYARMCTTIAGVVFLEEKMLIFHAGDSRVYRYDGLYLTRMTKDHSVVQELIDLGNLTEEEALSYGGRNQITRCLGSKISLLPEIYESRLPLQPGETMLICSDGMWDVVSPSQIREVLRRDCSPAEKAQTLVQLAKEQDSPDNITVCLCVAPDAPIQTGNSTPYVLD